ncbi:hypothetical protein LO762_03600 [Actinocorallia sp. API 0066]|uniref:hypothetical protein n=1 Tax=Actinocorallia sp. API 0066 TaxID=2896846 RepID=UPI001E304AF3|nr:hypothetical protein [Actinocorallia sp. API 0066]MCD0448284.1 hypothetical protein [Actinocorallia sp. API 0066]
MRAPRLSPAPRQVLPTAVMAACLAFATACGGYDPVGRLDHPPLPKPDVCADLPEDLVRTALGRKPSSCLTSSDDGAYGARFTAAAGAGSQGAASLVVSYLGRYDRNTGLDFWEVYGYVEKQRVTLIGVGEDGVYDPETGVAAAVAAQFIVRVVVQKSDGSGPPADAAERLMPVLEAALELGASATPSPSPSARPPSAPVIAP